MKIEEEVKRLGVTHCYTITLSMLVWGEARAWADWRDSWALINADEEKKRLALEVARHVPDKVNEDG